ncbi:MAG: hypothetical protein ABSA02_41735 [Trebonia sp.]|jgi:hypothetical protein
MQDTLAAQVPSQQAVLDALHFRTSDVKGVDQGLRVARWEAGRLAEIGL